MQIKGKKGIFFILDIVFGLFILIVGLTLLVTFYYQVPESNQFNLYTSDATLFFSSTKVGELKSNITIDLINSSVLDEDEYLGESLAKLCYLDDQSSFDKLVGDTMSQIIPIQFNYVARVSYLNETPCLSVNSSGLDSLSSSSLTSSSRLLLIGNNESFDPIGPYTFEVIVW